MSSNPVDIATRGVLSDNGGIATFGEWDINGIFISNIIGYTVPAATGIHFPATAITMIDLDGKARTLIDFGIVPSFRRNRFI